MGFYNTLLCSTKTSILVEMVRSKKGSTFYNPIDETLDEAQFRKRLKAIMDVPPKGKKSKKTTQQSKKKKK